MKQTLCVVISIALSLADDSRYSSYFDETFFPKDYGLESDLISHKPPHSSQNKSQVVFPSKPEVENFYLIGFFILSMIIFIAMANLHQLSDLNSWGLIDDMNVDRSNDKRGEEQTERSRLI